MRIIVLNDYGYVNGGATQVALGSVNALAKAGFDVTFVSGVGPVDPSIDRDLVRVINFGFHDLLGNPSRIDAAFRGIWDTRCSESLREVLSGYDRSDTIIHLHTWVKSLSSSVVNAAANLGFRMVCTLHDYFSVCPNGGLYNYPQQLHCNLRPMSLECIATNCDSRTYPQKLWRVFRHMVQNRFGRIPNSISAFIAVSDYSLSILRPLLPPSSRVFRVDNPIDIDRAAPSSILHNDTFTFVGRLSPEKGATMFAEASRLARVQAAFVGSGSEVEEISRLLGAGVLRGWQDRAGVIRSIQASRAIVFPSLWHETQGMVVSEAAALGVPAIVSDACAARDAVVDGETGLLFRAGDASDLARKLALLRDDHLLAPALGLEAYQRYWRAPSTYETHVKALVACYEKVLAG